MPRKDILCTEFSFTLPRGLIDTQNRVHRHGTMRLATAKDEISTQKEPAESDAPVVAVTLANLSVKMRRLQLTLMQKNFRTHICKVIL